MGPVPSVPTHPSAILSYFILSTAQEGAEFPFLCNKENICDNKISWFRRGMDKKTLNCICLP